MFALAGSVFSDGGWLLVPSVAAAMGPEGVGVFLRCDPASVPQETTETLMHNPGIPGSKHSQKFVLAVDNTVYIA